MPHQRRSVANEDLDPELTSVSRQVIGAAIEVHKALGPGFDSGVYRNALAAELDELGVSYALDRSTPVMYRDKEVGSFAIDMYVNDRFAVTILAERREVDGLDRTCQRAQLRAADLELGLIINFGERRLKDGLVRVLNPDKLNAMREESDHETDEAGEEEPAYQGSEE